MAMLIAWHTANAVRSPGSNFFSRGFLIVTPGITIRDRLRVLKPEDPDSYYRSLELVPPDLARRHRQGEDRHHQLPRFPEARDHGPLQGRRALLQGRGEPPVTIETEGRC